MNESRRGGPSDRRDLVVVPHRPGPLLWPERRRRQRQRDDLDDLIDDLFPEVDERPGWADAVLVLVGASLLTWRALGDPPVAVTVVGVIALLLGCTLPVRTAWRRSRQRRDRVRWNDLLTRGVALDGSSPAARRLVDAYEELLSLTTGPRGGTLDRSAVAAAHAALLEVASLLAGRAPRSDREVAYVSVRVRALDELVSVLRESHGTADDAHAPRALPGADALVEAREELDQVSRISSVTRIEELVDEARIHRRDPS